MNLLRCADSAKRRVLKVDNPSRRGADKGRVAARGVGKVRIIRHETRDRQWYPSDVARFESSPLHQSSHSAVCFNEGSPSPWSADLLRHHARTMGKSVIDTSRSGSRLGGG